MVEVEKILIVEWTALIPGVNGKSAKVGHCIVHLPTVSRQEVSPVSLRLHL
jgi:hypothetical protein